MFGGAAEEEDTDFLSPTGGARLASLFGLDQTATGTSNEFFQYTAPKQPKKGQPAAAAGPPSQKSPTPTPTSGAPSVFFATAVHAYRFTNGQYVKQGKYGAAVVGSHVTKEYRILLYISQQQQITTARIHSGFVLTVQPNNYSTFYDDQRQNWSIMFESEKAALDFCQQLCIAKYNSSPSADSVLYQDLIIGEGQGVEAGDSLEVAFTGWLLQNGALGQVFDSNMNKDKFLRLKLGSGKVIKGWDEGMVGLKKGGRRFLIVPPALAYGPQGVANRIPPDSTLAFEVEVKRVRLVKDTSSNGQSLGPRDFLAPSPAPNLENPSTDSVGVPPSTLPPKPGELAVRAKSNSISEQLANPDVAKAKLISRMAKMGQPMLPFLSGTAPAQLDSSDSEIEDPNTVRGVAQPAPSSPLKPAPPTTLPQMTAQVPQPAVSGLQVPSATMIPAPLQPHLALAGTPQGFQPYTGMAYAYPQATAAASQLQPVGAMYPAPFQAAGDMGSFLMTEARQQNTEIRLAVGKVADKMDRLVAKVEELQKQNSGHSLLPGISSVTMETAMIMSNIQRIIQENERLKQEVFEKSGRIEEQNEKISELIERNQRYVEQSNLLMEKRNTSLQVSTEHTQARVLHAEQEKVKVAEELAAATAQISRLQLELTGHQKKEMELRSQLNVALKEAERHGTQLNQLQAQLTELQESSEDTRSKFQVEKQSRRQLDGKVAALEEELADLRVEKASLEKNLSERKKKSLLERGQAEEEMDEIRKSYQEELDKLRQLLKKARTSTDQAASEQLSLMQAELESQWEAKCERLLSTAKEQHACQYQEVCEQRDAQLQKVSQLEEKLSLLRTTRSSEDETLSALQEQLEQLEPVKGKYLALQSQVAALKAHYEERIQELEKGTQPPSSADSTEEVKKIMNGVFRSLRGEFELEESYSGREVLGVVMNTIKTITLQLLEQNKESSGEEEEPGPVEKKPATPAAAAAAAADTEHRSSSPHEPPATPPSVPSDLPEAPPAAGPLASPEAGRGSPDSAASQARASEERDESTPAALPRTGLEISPLPASEQEAAVGSKQEDGSRTVEPVLAEEAVLEPAAEEGEQKTEGPVAGPGREEVSCLEAPSQDPGLSASLSGAAADEHNPSAEAKPGQVLSPTQANSSRLEDKGSFFKAAVRKPSTTGGPLEEDEEEELSMKGQPPPAPLFGDDDDDDDDLDWLG
ncbi:FK506-binding protein 15 isoform X2 [Hemicordylus capensis]|uniref:FK506-binding protein 15 isoform X2 n=1 Tax=Hemicordylus capensis TaxID=884348 RepID=UPI002304C6E8|nr:FK506-binding protein 15 isoform X2 [Hemicordylus capensis]